MGTEPRNGDAAAVQSSKVAQELRKLPAGTRRMLHIDDWMLSALDVAVRSVFVLTGSNSLDLEQRLDEIGDMIQREVGDMPPDLAAFLDQLPKRLEQLTADDVPRWTKRLTRDQHWRRFARRLVGAKSYDKLIAAVVEDGAVLMHGLRGLAERVRPYAVAFDDLTAVLTPAQIDDINGLPSEFMASALRFFIELDRVCEDLVASDFDWSVWRVPGRGETVEQADLLSMVERIRPLVSGPLHEELEKINIRLVRRLRGASSALRYSEDGTSQAANSLVELIDWTLRSAFTDEEVLAWLKCTGRDDTFDDSSGRSRPTKRGQALCFVHGGQIPAEKETNSAVHEAMAAAIVTARTGLQRLKHADTGSDSDRTQVERYQRAVEGFLTVSIRLLWSALPSDRIQELHTNLAA